jgi:hypothetical protein
MGTMKKLFRTRLGTAQRASSLISLPNPIEVRPYGRYGGGLFTEHPVGLLIAGSVVLMALWRLAEARWFFAGSLVLGAMFGIFLRLRHR